MFFYSQRRSAAPARRGLAGGRRGKMSGVQLVKAPSMPVILSERCTGAESSKGSDRRSGLSRSEHEAVAATPRSARQQLTKLQRVLGEEVPDPVSMRNAPILGEAFEKLIAETGEGVPHHQSSMGAGVEWFAERLQEKLKEHAASHGALRWPSFKEHALERSFRKLTFAKSVASYRIACLFVAVLTVVVRARPAR